MSARITGSPTARITKLIATIVPRLLRMIGAGGVATAVDTGVLFTVARGAGSSVTLAALLGSLAGGVTNFMLARRWVFAGAEGGLPAFARYLVFVVAGGAIVNAIAVTALTTLGSPLLVAKAGAIAATMLAWTYPVASQVLSPARHRAGTRSPVFAAGAHGQA